MEDEQEIDRRVKQIAEKLPRLADGRIDYSHAETALVLTCFVKFQEKILLLKRSDKVRTYRGQWNTVAGYIDEPKPLREKVRAELREELAISDEDVLHIKLGEPFEFHDPQIEKTWRVYPVLVELKREPKLRLDWEHTEFQWILPGEMKNFHTVPKLEESLQRALSSGPSGFGVGGYSAITKFRSP